MPIAPVSELAALTPVLDRLVAAHAEAFASYESALALAVTLCPRVPQELVIARDGAYRSTFEYYRAFDDESDIGDARLVADGDRSRQVLHSYGLERALEEEGARSKFGRTCKTKLKIAREYEAAREHVQKSSGLEDAGYAWNIAWADIEQLARRVVKIPATSFEDLVVKARAFSAWCAGGEPYDQYNAATIFGPVLAAELLRIGRAA